MYKALVIDNYYLHNIVSLWKHKIKIYYSVFSHFTTFCVWEIALLTRLVWINRLSVLAHGYRCGVYVFWRSEIKFYGIETDEKAALLCLKGDRI